MMSKKVVSFLLLLWLGSLLLFSLPSVLQVVADTENLYVSGFDEVNREWDETGASPWLSDSDTNYISTNVDKEWHEEFTFADHGGAESIISVYLYIEINGPSARNDYVVIDVYDGSSWSNVLNQDPDADAYQWYNVDVGGILDSWTKINNAELRVQYQRSGSPSTETIYVRRAYLYVEYSAGNNAPTNTSCTITDMDDTDDIYAQRKEYSLEYVVTDLDGFADIDYMEVRLKQGASTRAIFRYDEDTDTFTTELGESEWELNEGSSSAVESGNTITGTFLFTPEWDAIEEADLELECYVVDDEPESDTDTMQTDYVDCITNLLTSSIECTDTNDPDRVDVSSSIQLDFSVRYADEPGSSTPSSFYPPDAEFTSVSIYDSLNNNKGTDSTIVNGDGSISFTSESSVKSEVYNLYLDMVDADYTDGEESPTEQVISDQLELVSVAFDDNRVNIGASVEVRYVLQYDYDDDEFSDADGSIVGFAWDGVNSWWEKSVSAPASPSSETYDENDLGALTDTNYGLTKYEDDAGSDLIGDRITFLTNTLEVVDGRINLDVNGEWYAELKYEYDDAEVTDGTVSLNTGSMTFDAGGDHRWEYTFSLGSVGIESRNIASVSGNSYGITELNSAVTSDSEDIIFDRITFLSGTLEVTDGRLDFNSNGEWYAELKYEYDDAEVTDGTVTLNTGSMSWDAGDGRWEYTLNKGSVGDETRNIASVSGNTHGITLLNSVVTSDSETIIYDQLDCWSITDDTGDQRIDVSSTFELRYKLQYDYDDEEFDGADGSITGFVWDGVNSWWDKTVTGSSSVESTNYDETYLSITDTQYGLTVKKDVGGLNMITDRLTIVLSADDYSVSLDVQVNFTVTVTYEYDSTSCSTWEVDIWRNGTANWKDDLTDGDPDFTDVSSIAQCYQYDVTQDVSESTYDLTAFSEVSLITVTWSEEAEEYTLTIYFDSGIEVFYVDSVSKLNGSEVVFQAEEVANVTSQVIEDYTFFKYAYDSDETLDNPFYLTMDADYTVWAYSFLEGVSKSWLFAGFFIFLISVTPAIVLFKKGRR